MLMLIVHALPLCAVMLAVLPHVHSDKCRWVVCRVVTPLSYLEMALSNMTGSGAAIESKNSIRESIRALFPERECFALVRPITDEVTTIPATIHPNYYPHH